MCKKTNYHNTSNVRIDKCMKNLIEFINEHTSFKTVASCCGHFKYPMTIVIENDPEGNAAHNYEIVSGFYIWRKRNIYKKDKQGYYYIPEVIGKSLQPKTAKANK